MRWPVITIELESSHGWRRRMSKTEDNALRYVVPQGFPFERSIFINFAFVEYKTKMYFRDRILTAFFIKYLYNNSWVYNKI